MNKTNVQAYIGLGSNLYDPAGQITRARREIAASDSVEEIAFSPLYVSKPLGPQDQPDYVNAVMCIATCLPAAELLGLLQNIENAHGRIRSVKWGARTLDLDLLLYGHEVIHEPNLLVPHPEIPNRAFVLYPLSDIASGNLEVPGRGTLAKLLDACQADGLQRMVL